MTKMTGSASAGHILVLGASNTDLVCTTDRLPGPGETVASTSFAVYPGGKAANQAVAAMRAGGQVAFVGCFGDDDYGHARCNEMAAEGIDLAHARVIEDETSGLALIAVDQGGENLIITVGGANDRISGDQLRDAIDQSSWDVLLMPNEAPAEVVHQALTGMQEAITVFNAAPFVDSLRELARLVDVLVCNEVEASQFLGRSVTEVTAAHDVEELAGLAGGEAVITLGAAGAVGWDGETSCVAPALSVTVRDTTGAGDAFCGAFASWLARGASFEDALRAGTVAGSLATTRAGAQPSLPSLAEIQKHLKSS
ncbi:MAG: ribokinase [Thermomicrobiales bacterium]